MAGAAACVGGAVAAACAVAEPGPGDGVGSAGGSGAAGPVDEPGFGVGAVDGGGLVPWSERGSPLGWSLVLCKNPSGQAGSGLRERGWGDHEYEPASPTPVDRKQHCQSPSICCDCVSLHVCGLPGCVASVVCWPSPSF